MKRFLTIILASAALLAASATASAQFFNSLSMGVGVGVDGASLQLGAPVGSLLQLRVGGSYSPPVGYPFTILQDEDGSGGFDLKARLAYKGANAMLDFFPGAKTRFHFTVGVMAGNGKMLSVDGTYRDLAEEDHGVGFDISDRKAIYTDENGYCHADIASVCKIMPYAGIGSGRANNINSVVSLVFDIGVCYSQGFGAFTDVTDRVTGQTEYTRITSDLIDGQDNGMVDKVGSFPLLPVMKFTLFFRLF
ncbi:MAG: hypothetical protein IKX71_01965 [Bacteroidales bacterium]|nr:hypothetical protein [Bacteroidales bacterium]